MGDKTIKINFEDGSFILLEAVSENKINVIMCGRKDSNSVTMSSSSLDLKQVEKIVDFLSEWKSLERYY